jgi:hypothetical protein
MPTQATGVSAAGNPPASSSVRAELRKRTLVFPNDRRDGVSPASYHSWRIEIVATPARESWPSPTLRRPGGFRSLGSLPLAAGTSAAECARSAGTRRITGILNDSTAWPSASRQT